MRLYDLNRVRETQIGELRHRVVLCSQKDVIVNQGEIVLKREVFKERWARIETRDNTKLSLEGFAMRDNRNYRNYRSHWIVLRYNPEIMISGMAWIFERRLKSAPRWFKVLRTSITEMSGVEFIAVDSRLIQNSDDIAVPVYDEQNVTNAMPLPDGVSF